MKNRIISLLCIFVFCLSAFSIPAMAEAIPAESEDVVQSELDARIEQDTAYRNEIVQLYKNKEYDEAIDQAEAFLADNPDSPVAEKFVKTCIYSYVGKAKLLLNFWIPVSSAMKIPWIFSTPLMPRQRSKSSLRMRLPLTVMCSTIPLWSVAVMVL